MINGESCIDTLWYVCHDVQTISFCICHNTNYSWFNYRNAEWCSWL